MKETFGEFIKRQRNGIGLTQTQLAARIGIDAAGVSKIENNKAVLGEDRLSAVADLFSLDLVNIKDEYYGEIIANLLCEGKCTEKALSLAEEKMHIFKARRIKQTTLNLE